MIEQVVNVQFCVAGSSAVITEALAFSRADFMSLAASGIPKASRCTCAVSQNKECTLTLWQKVESSMIGQFHLNRVKCDRKFACAVVQQ